MSWILRANDFKQSHLAVEVFSCEKKEMFLLSLKKLVLYWGLAAVSILVPLLHFILVPSFLLIGVYVFLSQYKNTYFLKKGTYTCPSCNHPSSLENIYFFAGKKVSCDLCMAQLVIEHEFPLSS